MNRKKIIFNSDGSITISKSTYEDICLKLDEKSPTYLYLLEQQDKNIVNAIKYLEKKRIRNKAIVDVDILVGILKRVSE